MKPRYKENHEPKPLDGELDFEEDTELNDPEGDLYHGDNSKDRDWEEW